MEMKEDEKKQQEKQKGWKQWRKKLAINTAARAIVEMAKKGWELLMEVLNEQP